LENRFVLISGCSGGGKSTLLAELSARGYPVVKEPGRRIIAGEFASGGSALPWGDPAGLSPPCDRAGPGGPGDG
jgi:predicted ATPase